MASNTQDNAGYWIERHEKHANKMVSVGDIRRSEEENLRLYAWKKRMVYSILHALETHVLMGRRVLDAGCGIGLVSELFYALGGHVSGVDASPVAIEHAAHRCPDGEFQAASIVDFQFEGKFDIVFSADVLYHVVDDENWKAAVHNLLNHCTPGGWLILIDQLRAEVTSPAPHVRYRTRELYREIMAGAPALEVIVPGFERVVVYRRAPQGGC